MLDVLGSLTVLAGGRWAGYSPPGVGGRGLLYCGDGGRDWVGCWGLLETGHVRPFCRRMLAWTLICDALSRGTIESVVALLLGDAYALEAADWG